MVESKLKTMETVSNTKIKRTKKSKRVQKVSNIFLAFIFISCACFVFIGKYTFFKENVEENSNTKANYVDTINTSSGCDYVSIVGDDICDDIANTQACAYDFGDCCSLENDRNSSCQDCFCFIDTQVQLTYLQKNCQVLDRGLEELLILESLGDGQCHLAFNQEEYDFDLGDCCIENVQCVMGGFKTMEFFDFVETFDQPVECPEQVCIPSNTFCVQAQVGDGICQDYNNIKMCDFDGGDCCLTNKGNECCDCKCKGMGFGGVALGTKQ